ncbi:MAG: hypothetical protein JW791_01635 [Nanoarchaeota archaeon]|nr:hypothetical protein [Nanoarchaeota archaeon]
MRKTVTPVVAIILLIFMTVAASVAAFIWMSSTQTSIQETAGASIESSSVSSCSRLNLISTRGDGVTVQNIGCDTIDKVSVLIDGVLTDYNLDYPIGPGESSIITYASLANGTDHTIKVVLDNSQTITSTISEDKSTLEAGFCSSVCGDGVCCYSQGESISTCVFDCVIKTYLEYDTFSLYENHLINAGDKRVFGNRSLFYSSTALSGGKLNFVDEKIALYLFPDDPIDNIYSYIYYSIYDNGEWGSISRLTPVDNAYTYVLDMSQPDIRGVINFIYQHCLTSISDCDLYARSWSRNNGFSEPVQLSESTYDSKLPHDGVKIASSSNGNYKVAVWIIDTNNPINYAVFEDGEWSGVQTLNLPSPADNQITTLAVNDKGEIAIAFYKYSLDLDTYHMLFYNNTWWEVNVTTLGYPFGVSSREDDFIISVSDNFNILSNYNSTIFDGETFTPITHKTIKESNIYAGDFKNFYNDIMTIFASTNGYYAVFLNETSDSWDYATDFTLLTGVCEEYEKRSSDCATETWCSDGVDNDEDGLYDSADTLDCP